jgi:hypothetical protein
MEQTPGEDMQQNSWNYVMKKECQKHKDNAFMNS